MKQAPPVDPAIKEPVIRVLMVCLGNICRSPTAHGVFLHLLQQDKLQHCVEVDSAGTGAYHLGEAPDSRAMHTASKRGYDISALRARQVRPADFAKYDYILAMDKQNLRDLKDTCPPQFRSKIKLFLSYGHAVNTDVPDPYYYGGSGFEEVLDLVEGAASALLQHIKIFDLNQAMTKTGD